MTVAGWEFYSVAVMLVATHGADAELEAERRLAAAQTRGDRGGMVVWSAVKEKLVRVRAERDARGLE